MGALRGPNHRSSPFPCVLGGACVACRPLSAHRQRFGAEQEQRGPHQRQRSVLPVLVEAEVVDVPERTARRAVHRCRDAARKRKARPRRRAPSCPDVPHYNDAQHAVLAALEPMRCARLVALWLHCVATGCASLQHGIRRCTMPHRRTAHSRGTPYAMGGRKGVRKGVRKPDWARHLSRGGWSSRSRRPRPADAPPRPAHRQPPRSKR